MGSFRPIFAILMRTKRVQCRQVVYHFKACELENLKKKINFAKIFKFHNSKETFMNFAKYIVAHIFTKFKYFGKQIIFPNSLTQQL